MVAFEEKFFKGELSPSLKSEEPSDEDTANPVKVVKGKSFSKLVLENGEYTAANLSQLADWIVRFGLQSLGALAAAAAGELADWVVWCGCAMTRQLREFLWHVTELD